LKIVLFYHSLVSDWNHGNAHFLRGVATELIERGNDVAIYEPADAWSRDNLVQEHGEAPIAEFHARYPQLRSTAYKLSELDLDEALAGAQLVIVHEWNEHELVRRVGQHRASGRGYRLFFHDTHHRAITSPSQMQGYDLSNYDGVLAYGEVLRELYEQRNWARRAWTWHEAADTRVFHPIHTDEREGDVVWIGNWGDDERSAELDEFLIEPIAVLGLKGKIFGVRYPETARERLQRSGIEYGGWLPNYRAPEVFARYRMTVHVPRRPYVEALRGIPTIRPFEALACGIPLISAPWEDAEHLFTPGKDFLVARNGEEMKNHMRALLADKEMARDLAAHGLRTIQQRHTCAHRVDELLSIYEEVNA
jgi:spore maturation protein CgeB